MIPYERGWLKHLKAKWPFPGGWRNTSQPTASENAAIEALLEKQRLELERDKPLTILIAGREFARQHYIHRLAGELSGTTWNNIPKTVIKAFLGRSQNAIERRRVRWGLYYNVAQFDKAWRKRLTRLARTQNPSEL